MLKVTRWKPSRRWRRAVWAPPGSAALWITTAGWSGTDPCGRMSTRKRWCRLWTGSTKPSEDTATHRRPSSPRYRETPRDLSCFHPFMVPQPLVPVVFLVPFVLTHAGMNPAPVLSNELYSFKIIRCFNPLFWDHLVTPEPSSSLLVCSVFHKTEASTRLLHLRWCWWESF